jgi:butyryl-CoA dehydrogenase
MGRLQQTEGLTDVQHEILTTVREFVDKEILPYATELEHKDEFPEAIVDAMKGMGLFGLMIPEEYGGLGESLLTYSLVVEQIARGWMSVSGVINTHFIVAYMLMHHGTQEQKERLLPLMAPVSCAAASRCRSRTAAPTSRASRAGCARRRRVRPRRPEDVAHQRRARRHHRHAWSKTDEGADSSTRT